MPSYHARTIDLLYLIGQKCFACDLIFTIPFVSSSGKQGKLKRYAAINISSINNLIKKNTAITCKT